MNNLQVTRLKHLIANAKRAIRKLERELKAIEAKEK